MIIKEVKKDFHVKEVSLTKYEYYEYFESSFEEISYLLGEPTLYALPPEEKDISEYCQNKGVIDEVYWIIITEDDDELLIDGQNYGDRSKIDSYCVSGDCRAQIKEMISAIKEERWPVFDNIRKKTFFRDKGNWF